MNLWKTTAASKIQQKICWILRFLSARLLINLWIMWTTGQKQNDFAYLCQPKYEF